MDVPVRTDVATGRLSLYRWQFIWSLFVRSSPIRTWLFENQPPPADHVYHSLRNGPVLLGFDFRPVTTTETHYASDYPYPNIGDLSTVYSFYDGTLLGFNFGNCSIQPFIPPIYHITKDPQMSNAKTIVRRTARRFLNFPDAPCFLTIEFSWYETSALSVFTWINPIPSAPNYQGNSSHSFTPHVPLFNHGELRFYTPSAAARLKSLADACNMLPSYQPYMDTLLRAEEQHYVLRIQQPSIPFPLIETYDALNNSDLPVPRISDFSHSDFACNAVGLHSPTTVPGSISSSPVQEIFSSAESVSPTLQKPDYIRQAEIAKRELRSMNVWSAYHNNIIRAREKGVFMSLVAYRTYWPEPHERHILGRYGSYQYMRTRVSVSGRVQKLCKQLGIVLSSPKADALLIRRTPSNPGTPERVVDCAENDVHILSQENYLSNSTSHRVSQVYDIDSNPIVSRNTYVSSEYDVEGPMSGPVSRSTEVTTFSAQEKEVSEQNDIVSPNEHADKEKESVRNGDLQVNITEPYEDTDEKNRDESHDYGSNRNTSGEASTEQECPSDSTSPSVSSSDVLQCESSKEESENYAGTESEDQNPQCSDEKKEYNSRQNQDKQLYEFRRRPDPQSINKTEKGPKSKWSKMVWTCDRCGAHIRGKRGNLNRHIASKHDNIRAYECKMENCGRKFQTRLNMVRHVSAVHHGRPYACDKCSRTFKTELDRHNHNHTAHIQVSRQLSCPICGGCFGRRSTLNRHLMNVHREINPV